ncbi:MAG: nucleotidyltransferase domain-containing protein [Firmicutes bacterium]|jgi:predicted nucleotidyltransferase|nr:nucleotidyltransferase domain-containing protein [Bacillota bacterium]
MAAWVFGSTGTGHATAMSDLDLAVLIDGDISLMEELSLSADLAVALGRDDVDLLVLNSARNDLQHAVMSQGEIIYDRIL